MEDIHNLIGHFLKQKGYTATLQQFEADYGFAINPRPLPFINEDLETIINEKIHYNQLNKDEIDKFKPIDNLNLELDHQFSNWSKPSPSKSTSLFKFQSLPISITKIDGLLYITTNKMEIIRYNISEKSRDDFKFKKIVKKVIALSDPKLLLLVSIDGKATINSFNDIFEELFSVQLHSRLVIDAKFITINDTQFIISLGWDNFVKIHKVVDTTLVFVKEYKSSHIFTSFDITCYLDKLYIVLGKQEITLLDVLSYDFSSSELELAYQISINDAQFSSIGFSPRHISIQNIPGSIPLIAISTSQDPMRVVIVSLQPSADTQIQRFQIIKNLKTETYQTKFSKSVIQWRLSKDGKSQGIWVMGEDGSINGIDLVRNLIEKLTSDQGVIKDCITYSDEDGEVLISCGEKELLVWR